MFISTALVRSLIIELEERGIPTEGLLRSASLDRAALDRTGHGVRDREFDRMLRQAFELSGDPALGLAVGSRTPKTVLHVLGMLVLNSATVREAHRQVRRYGELIASQLDWQLSERAQLACFGYTLAEEQIADDTQRFLAECMVAFALRFGRDFAPSERASEVWFQHPEPHYASEYAKVFRCPVRFRQTSNAVLFPRATLDRVRPHAEPMLQTSLVGLAEDLKASTKADGTLASRVRLALRYTSDLANVDSDSMAQRWGLSRRALRRKLALEGASLSELLDEARCRRAFDELRRPERKIKEVAEDLGYSEASAFHRAFKRWSGGRTPTDYKTELGGGARASSEGHYADAVMPTLRTAR
jgi:AraC-like DNA-binding protein